MGDVAFAPQEVVRQLLGVTDVVLLTDFADFVEIIALFVLIVQWGAYEIEILEVLNVDYLMHNDCRVLLQYIIHPFKSLLTSYPLPELKQKPTKMYFRDEYPGNFFPILSTQSIFYINHCLFPINSVVLSVGFISFANIH